jgi:hypothetical protein
MPQIKIADRVLLALADMFEHGNINWLKVVHEFVEEYEDVKQRYAALVAGGLLRGGPDSLYQFTDAGYLKYSDRIRALRALGPA